MEFGWNPWHGCKKKSEGCLNCFVHTVDARYEKDTSIIQRNKIFDLPIKKKKDGTYKIPSGSLINTCFTSDFLLEEADCWREEAWNIIRVRKDCTFMFFTKRIERLIEHLPKDWNDGWDNVVIGCSCENQKRIDERLPLLLAAPIKKRFIICVPLLENLDLSKYLGPEIALVSVGGESGANARICEYDWIINIRNQCLNKNVAFMFHQTGAKFKKDGKLYYIKKHYQRKQASKANLNTKKIIYCRNVANILVYYI